ncbi:unnamed protein product [Adineta ricciae]|uniref:Uncharacterized protein n=2 Tax=Adineta ricciae TaxID=249248 RepID=A0A815Q462_ADIRI|nr:unnamed protein product [Adineta ricciae]
MSRQFSTYWLAFSLLFYIILLNLWTAVVCNGKYSQYFYNLAGYSLTMNIDTCKQVTNSLVSQNVKEALKSDFYRQGVIYTQPTVMLADLEYHVQSIHQSWEQREPAPEIKFSLWHTFKRHIPRFILTVVFDLVLPLVLFFVLQKRIGTLYALLISGAPPLVMVILKAIISRTLDALGLLILLGFVISAVVALITKNDTVLLLEKSLVTGVASIIFAVSLIPIPCCCKRWHWRPLVYFIYQDLLPTKRKDIGLPDDIFNHEPNSMYGLYDSQKKADKKEVAQVYNWLYTHCRSFRRTCYILTIIWAIGLFLEFVGRLILIFVNLSVNQIYIYGHVILGVAVGICGILTVILVSRERKKTIAFVKQWNQGYGDVEDPEKQRSSLSLWLIGNSPTSNGFVSDIGMLILTAIDSFRF